MYSDSLIIHHLSMRAHRPNDRCNFARSRVHFPWTHSICLTGVHALQKEHTMRLPLKRYLALLLTYLKPQWGRTLLMSVTLLASIGLQLLGPQILRYFIDTAIAGGPSTSLVLAGLYFIGVTLANQVVSVATTYLSENVAWTATNQLLTHLLAHCLSLEMSFNKEH